MGFDPWVGKIIWRREWQPTPVFLPGKFHRQRSLVGYNPWGLKESDTTEHVPMHRITWRTHEKHTYFNPTLRISDLVGLRWSLRICISIKFPSEVIAVGSGSTLQEPQLSSTGSQCYGPIDLTALENKNLGPTSRDLVSRWSGVKRPGMVI